MYTSLGIVCAFVAAVSLKNHHIEGFLVSLLVAVIIDGTDGALARYFEVKKILPGFDGARLDDIVDYITYAFLPALALVEFGVLPWKLWWIAVLPMLASLYGFCRQAAKTGQSFVGFPSYWNVVFVYCYVLNIAAGGVVGILLILSVLVFIPVHYIYPTRTVWLRGPTIVFTCIWGVALGAICLKPHQPWARHLAVLSLLYPVYYGGLSLQHHRRLSKQRKANNI
jgi:phosphatidylcholine synthase